jgi:hypothetical protein
MKEFRRHVSHVHNFNKNPAHPILITKEESATIAGVRNTSKTAVPEVLPAEKAQDTKNKERNMSRIRRSTFDAKPLYLKPPVTGKYDIDVVTGNRALFQDVLHAHHMSVTSQVLGVETVKQHYARRDRLKVQPLSYDDKRFNPPSPQ